MKIPALTFALLLLAIVPVQAEELELVVNGEFEQPLSSGWEQSSAGSNTVITRGTGYDHDEDFEAHLSKGDGTGHVKIWQVVEIPTTDLNFSANLKARAYGGGGAWSASALIISYQDWSGAQLGRTALADLSYECPWTGSSTFHIIDTLPNDWEYHSFNIDDELLNLPGVDPEEISRIELSLLITAADC